MGSPIVHFEIIGRDAAQLKNFYTEIFDWKIGDLIPDMGNYELIDGASSGLPAGSGSPTTATRAPPCMRRCPTCRRRSTRSWRSEGRW